ncbi:MAG: UDP-N-acetylmuramoyl-L-alanine--D-glutamate ligase, partial [Rhodoferax sp.]|nr:UDP-N-acetylmuramoyl-L-alanine--D-glutamate ligase [Rhodoferax sp.]
LKAELPGVRFLHAPFTADVVQGTGVRAVFKSPGLAPADTASLINAAQALGLWVGGELSLFAQALQDLAETQGYAPKLLAITGTNGKTTVTALTGHLLQWAGKRVAVAGNIGPSLLDTLAQALDQSFAQPTNHQTIQQTAVALPEVWVLELSSFQLDLPSGLQASAATVLNLTQDHLDWHSNMEAYAQAKSRIFAPATRMVLCRDDAAVMALLKNSQPGTETAASPAKPEAVRGGKRQRTAERAYVSFGTDMPQRPGDFGLEAVHGMSWLVRALEADETGKKSKDLEELHIQRLMPADALRIRGRHNASNALAALALCASVGCALGPLLFGLREYRGEPHRVQSVGILDGVEFFDDSKGTNVGATVAALRGLGAERKLVLILGGEGKGQDFSPLAEPVARSARAVLLIGRDAPLIRQALATSGTPLLDASSMEDAVAQAQQQAHSGDAVLLSPACASFDMFQDYAHRARCFVAAVQQLGLTSGTELEQAL